MESEKIMELMPWASNVCAVALSIGVASLGLWVATPAFIKIVNALEHLLRLARRTIASELRLRRMQTQSDRQALDMWIRDAFQYKAEARDANGRAMQERSMRLQLAKGEGMADV